MEALDLRVEQGEKVALVGANGAGKSTLLELIAGFRFPFRGQVEVLGQALTKETARTIRKHLGLVFQDPDDQVFMPRVWDDVAFGPKNLRWSPDQVREAVDRSLLELRIKDLEDRAPHRLSYGQKKRVAVAGVLAMSPEILLLDEPTTGLDYPTRCELLKKISGMSTTMLITTHHVEDLVGFVDRLVVLDVTKVAEGDPREVMTRDDLMAKAKLEVPTIGRVYRLLRQLGHPVEDLPMSLDDAIDLLAAKLRPTSVVTSGSAGA